MMADYRIYRFDGISRIEMAEWIDALDDDDAIRKAVEIGSTAAKSELWQGNRLIIALGREGLIE